MFHLVRVTHFFLFFWWLTLEQCFVSRPSWAGNGSYSTNIHTGAYTSPARAPRLLADTHTRVRPSLLNSRVLSCLSNSSRLFSNVRHALLLANVVADSRYMLFTEFSGENGRRLREYLAAVRSSVLAGLEHGGSDPFRAVLL